MKSFRAIWHSAANLRLVWLALAVLGLAGCRAAAVAPTAETATLPPAVETTPAANQVQAWLTLPDQSQQLAQQPALTLTTAASQTEQVIELDPSLTYQPFEGAGAAMTESSAWLILNKLDETARQQLMNDLFTRQGSGIGLSYLRVPMGASDFALRNYSYSDISPAYSDPELRSFSIEPDLDDVIPALRLARSLNPALKLVGSPWSAPAWMKVSKNMNGGALRPEYLAAFAQYHLRFVQAYAEAGVPIDALTPQNEPMHETSGYPTMVMPPEQQAELIRDYLGPALDDAGLDTQIIIFDHNWDLVQYPLKVLSDPEAAAYIDGVAFHCYGGDVSAQSVLHQAHPDQPVYFTECSGGGWATDWSDNVSWNLRTLVIGNFRNWGRNLILWNLALDENDGPQNGGCGNCRGVVTINQADGSVTYNEEFTILGHVTKFVDPGAYRIESTAFTQGGPENVAFINPDGSLVLIVHSTQATTFEVAYAGQRFTYSLPAQGTVTFKWAAGATAGATATPAPTQTPRPSPTPGTVIRPENSLVIQDFENTGAAYSVYQAEVSQGQPAYAGQSALHATSASGEWHTVGTQLAGSPVTAGAFSRLCFWIQDNTDSDGDGNTIGVRLVDASGANEEKWSDHASVGENPKTQRGEWVQICLNLSAYSLLDLNQMAKIEFAMYWDGSFAIDEITLEP